MQQLFAFLYRTRVFSIFILLEVVAGILVVNNNSYQGAAFFTSANTFVGNTYEMTTNISEYFNLKRVNEELAQENATLKDSIQGIHLSSVTIDPQDSTQSSLINTDKVSTEETYGDDIFTHYIAAKVINNSVLKNNNYITINKGLQDGIRPGMGVVTNKGVVGQVKASSDHFSTCYSLLHSQMVISSEVKKINALCSTVWETSDAQTATVKYLARHLDVAIGDTITTSGYNTVYPPGIMIGVVNAVEMSPKDRFLQVTINLSEDFNTLSYVYVTDATLKSEKDSLEQLNIQD